jgi:hypothetical protein
VGFVYTREDHGILMMGLRIIEPLYRVRVSERAILFVK